MQKFTISFFLLLFSLLLSACNDATIQSATQTADALKTELIPTDTQKIKSTFTPIQTATASPIEILACFMKPVNFEMLAQELLNDTQKISFPERNGLKWTWQDGTGREFTLEKKGVKDKDAILKFYSELENPFYFTVDKYAFLVISFTLDENTDPLPLLYFPYEHQFVDFLCPRLPERFEMGLPNTAFHIHIDEDGIFHVSPFGQELENNNWCYGPLRDYFLLNGELIRWAEECPVIEILEQD